MQNTVSACVTWSSEVTFELIIIQAVWPSGQYSVYRLTVYKTEFVSQLHYPCRNYLSK